MDDDFDGFKAGLDIGENYTEEDAAELFSLLRQFMVKNENYEWQVDHRSNGEFISEMYREGLLYQRGDVVESLTTGLVGRIHRCGANHLICITENGLMFKSFVQDVHKV